MQKLSETHGIKYYLKINYKLEKINIYNKKFD